MTCVNRSHLVVTRGSLAARDAVARVRRGHRVSSIRVGVRRDELCRQWHSHTLQEGADEKRGHGTDLDDLDSVDERLCDDLHAGPVDFNHVHHLQNRPEKEENARNEDEEGRRRERPQASFGANSLAQVHQNLYTRDEEQGCAKERGNNEEGSRNLGDS